LRSGWLLGGLSAACLFAVAFLVLYPHPTRYVQNLDRALHPPIDPTAVAQVSARLPEDPSLIERWVRNEIAFDANDYAAWDVVLYIATPAEVLERGRGPCYGRAVVLASILEAKGIPYRLMANTTHVWVDYSSREPMHWYERPQYAAFVLGDGRWRFAGMGWVAALPHQVAWLVGHLWATMPWTGKMILLGALLSAVGVVLWWRPRHSAGAQKPREEMR
jgi:hypothetical protein